jgi:hypothetical protein
LVLCGQLYLVREGFERTWSCKRPANKDVRRGRPFYDGNVRTTALLLLEPVQVCSESIVDSSALQLYSIEPIQVGRPASDSQS